MFGGNLVIADTLFCQRTLLRGFAGIIFRITTYNRTLLSVLLPSHFEKENIYIRCKLDVELN